MSGSRNTLPITEGALFPQILRFSMPLALSGILQLLFNAADIIVVGKFAGSNSLAAVGATAALINLLVGLFIGMSIGVNVIVARYLGSRDEEGVRRAIPTAMIFSVFLGFLVMAIGLVFSIPLLLTMDTPEELIPLSSLYLKIYFLGMPGSIVYNFGAAILRAWGDTKRPLYYLTISGATNAALNLVLVIVFHLDVAGVAIATCVSQYISMVLVVRCLTKQPDPKRLDLHHLRFDGKEVWRMIQIGLPAGLQSVIFSVSNTMIQSSVNSFGTTVIAANTAAGNLNGFQYTACNSVYHASITFASQNLGARKLDRVGKSFWACTLAVSLIGILSAVPVYFFGRQLLTIYISTSDPAYEQIIATGFIKIIYCCLFQFLGGLMEVTCGMVRGLGKTWLPMVVSVFGVCIFRILWLYTFFAANHTLETLYVSYPISWLLTALIHAACFFLFFRKLQPKKPRAV